MESSEEKVGSHGQPSSTSNNNDDSVSIDKSSLHAAMNNSDQEKGSSRSYPCTKSDHQHLDVPPKHQEQDYHLDLSDLQRKSDDHAFLDDCETLLDRSIFADQDVGKIPMGLDVPMSPYTELPSALPRFMDVEHTENSNLERAETNDERIAPENEGGIPAANNIGTDDEESEDEEGPYIVFNYLEFNEQMLKAKADHQRMTGAILPEEDALIDENAQALPRGQVSERLSRFLTSDEIRWLDQGEREMTAKMVIVDYKQQRPIRVHEEIEEVNYSKYDKKYVLNKSGWKAFRATNILQVGDVVQIWAYRVHRALGFALVML